MISSFSIQATSHFERTLGKLSKYHPDLVDYYAKALTILQADPYNYNRIYPIKKLEGVHRGNGQFRIRIERWRFRYDIVKQVVYLKACSLRREDTYR